MKRASIRFPHQLFKNLDLLPKYAPVFLMEETLFFNQYNFHKQKILFHRASMKCYADHLSHNGFEVHYIDAQEDRSDIRVLLKELVTEGYGEFHIIDPTDNWLEKRIKSSVSETMVKWHDSPLFLNTTDDLSHFFKPSKKNFFQTSFYKQQRRKRNILMEGENPKGGKWTYDVDNRKRYPKNRTPPAIAFPDADTYFTEAKSYVESHYKNNIGSLSQTPLYPINFESAERWFQDFLENRFHKFGDYEDALVKDASCLHHSVLTPLLNVGLISVEDVLQTSISFSDEHKVPINSVEGFVRQIIGWREFIRGMYQVKGAEERTRNFWGYSRKMPKSFYDGTTGIVPVDITIKKVLKTGYAHHIERLMVLCNFMLLCEFDPDDIYQWFMELFIDAYDWVMVPNVYGMGLFADGGLMSTKPYISSSNYINKMGDYEGGEWEEIWDGLFWNFMDKNRAFFEQNPRLAMLLRNLDKMCPEKKERHLQNAEEFLNRLDTRE
ncbi:cryptochrome/photolyase family protein [Allomuricauda taeanensis]|uniref:cryptochrome/photolyase family protein n=1 Tax=Flagellimonas taeanensis TaxID=1005926 RepID=UPI002E7BF765|nr:cryptochrome/photolyase family protein [Allomuricauda taeanensis]MEE1963650.1 cryptochrome/photolyase family protein [Allomuricauda taeanensis]